MNPQLDIMIGKPFGAGYGKIHAETGDDQAEIEQLAVDVEQHVKPVAENAPSSCIDGRACIACMDGSEPELRPGVAGGGMMTAYAAAELTGWFGDAAGSSEEKIAAVHAQLLGYGIVSGGHCDEAASEHNFDGGKTGCGANDRMPEILQRVHSDNTVIASLSETLLGEAFNAAHTAYRSEKALADDLADWRPQAMVDELGAKESQRSIEILASDHSETHGHKESFVVFNYVENTTVDRDTLVLETGKQVFDVDVWYLEKLANAMAPADDAEAVSRQLHAMVAYQVATYLTLCDGSQRPLIITPAV